MKALLSDLPISTIFTFQPELSWSSFRRWEWVRVSSQKVQQAFLSPPQKSEKKSSATNISSKHWTNNSPKNYFKHFQQALVDWLENSPKFDSPNSRLLLKHSVTKTHQTWWTIVLTKISDKHRVILRSPQVDSLSFYGGVVHISDSLSLLRFWNAWMGRERWRSLSFFPPFHSLQSKKCMALNLAASFRNPAAGMVVGIHIGSTISELTLPKTVNDSHHNQKFWHHLVDVYNIARVAQSKTETFNLLFFKSKILSADVCRLQVATWSLTQHLDLIGKDRLPTTIFQGRLVKLQRCII